MLPAGCCNERRKYSLDKPSPGIRSGLWQHTHGRQHTHSRQLPPEAARWLRNTSSVCSCLHRTQPGTAPGAGFWGATISEGSGMEHRYLQGQSKEIAVCFSHLGKVERLCKSETRRSLAKPVVFWCCKRLNYTK